MKTIKLGNTRYTIPTSTRELTLKQFLDALPYLREREKLFLEEGKAQTPREVILLQLSGIDNYDHIISKLSPIPYEVLEKCPMNDVQKGNVYKYMAPIFEHIIYIPSTKNSFRKFKFNGIEYYFLDFDKMTVKQKHWFESWWKDAYAEVKENINQFKFEHLSRLIAIAAFKKETLNLINEIPFSIKKTDYENIALLVEEKAKSFEVLPLPIAFQCLDFFFINLKRIGINIPTSTRNLKSNLQLK